MKRTPPPSRRGFLAAGAMSSACLTASLCGGLLATAWRGQGAGVFVRAVARKAARAIGKALLLTATVNPPVRWQIEERIRQLRRMSSAPRNEQRAALRAAIERDFVVGDVVIVRGWVLSATEAALCLVTCAGEDRSRSPTGEIS